MSGRKAPESTPLTSASSLKKNSLSNTRSSYTDPSAAVVNPPIKDDKNSKKVKQQSIKSTPKSKESSVVIFKQKRHSHKYERLVSRPVQVDQLTGGRITSSDPDLDFLRNAGIKKLPKLTETQQIFFNLVKDGDLSGVEGFLAKYPGTSRCDLIHALNFEGYTVLHIAAARQNEEMVDLLCAKYGDCVDPALLQDVFLHAIQEGNVTIVRQLFLVLEQREFIGGMPTDTQKAEQKFRTWPPDKCTPFENANFTKDVYPYMLAAQGQSYELLNFLTDSGFGMARRHDDNCVCPEVCFQISDLERSYRRLHEYQALCNPVYICFKALKGLKGETWEEQAAREKKTGSEEDQKKKTEALKGSVDPVNEAFGLILELENCLENEVNFVPEYQAILENLRQFTCDLLSQCRDKDEVMSFLRRKSGVYGGVGDTETFPRISWAMQTKQKEFIAHPNCQMLLYGQWVRGWENWRRLSTFATFMHVIFRILGGFILSGLICMFHQRGSVAGMLASPVSRFLNVLAAYIWFLGFVFVINVTVRADGDRGPPRTGFEWPIILCVFGHLMYAIKQMTPNVLEYLKSTWNWLDFFTQALFIVSFVFWLVAWISEPGHNAIPRKFWPADEPMLIAEIFFALASILAYTRLVHLLQLNYQIGPLVTAMGQMGKNITDVIVFLSIIICGYGAGLYYLYRTYDGWKDTDDHGDDVEQNAQFTTWIETLNTLFYALFGMADASSPEIISRTIVDPYNPKLNATNHHKLTEMTGKLIFGSFHLIATMMAMNLVGGLMISHYDRIRGNVDMEWKFVRAQIWVSFMRNTVNASPLNLLPTIPFILSNFRKEDPDNQFMFAADKDAEKQKGSSYRRITSENFNRIIIERYIRDKAEVEEAERASSDLITALREDLAELRETMDTAETTLEARNRSLDPEGTAFKSHLEFQRLHLETKKSHEMAAAATAAGAESDASGKSGIDSLILEPKPSQTLIPPQDKGQGQKEASSKKPTTTQSDNLLQKSPVSKPPMKPKDSAGKPPSGVTSAKSSKEGVAATPVRSRPQAPPLPPPTSASESASVSSVIPPSVGGARQDLPSDASTTQGAGRRLSDPKNVRFGQSPAKK